MLSAKIEIARMTWHMCKDKLQIASTYVTKAWAVAGASYGFAGIVLAIHRFCYMNREVRASDDNAHVVVAVWYAEARADAARNDPAASAASARRPA